jgi:hypothetical protein
MTFVHSGKAHLGSRVVGGLTTRRVRANSWMPTRRVGVHLTVPKSLLREQNLKSEWLRYGLDRTLTGSSIRTRYCNNWNLFALQA